MQSAVWSLVQLVQVRSVALGALYRDWTIKAFRVPAGRLAVQNDTDQTIASDEPQISLRCSFQSIFPVFLYCLL